MSCSYRGERAQRLAIGSSAVDGAALCGAFRDSPPAKSPSLSPVAATMAPLIGVARNVFILMDPINHANFVETNRPGLVSFAVNLKLAELGSELGSNLGQACIIASSPGCR